MTRCRLLLVHKPLLPLVLQALCVHKPLLSLVLQALCVHKPLLSLVLQALCVHKPLLPLVLQALCVLKPLLSLVLQALCVHKPLLSLVLQALCVHKPLLPLVLQALCVQIGELRVIYPRLSNKFMRKAQFDIYQIWKRFYQHIPACHSYQRHRKASDCNISYHLVNLIFASLQTNHLMFGIQDWNVLFSSLLLCIVLHFLHEENS